MKLLAARSALSQQAKHSSNGSSPFSGATLAAQLSTSTLAGTTQGSGACGVSSPRELQASSQPTVITPSTTIRRMFSATRLWRRPFPVALGAGYGRGFEP
jgi:hypothetical protein